MFQKCLLSAADESIHKDTKEIFSPSEAMKRPAPQGDVVIIFILVVDAICLLILIQSLLLLILLITSKDKFTLFD